MLEVEPIGQRDRTSTGSGRIGSKAVAGAASEAFARWLHHRYAPFRVTTIGGDTSFRSMIPCCFTPELVRSCDEYVCLSVCPLA